MTRIALDAMGGDKAPGEIVRGGVDAVLEMKELKVYLVVYAQNLDWGHCSSFYKYVRQR